MPIKHKALAEPVAHGIPLASATQPRQFGGAEGWELQNMLTLSRIMVSAALAREESRGVHLRTDFPDTDDEHWHRHLSYRRIASGLLEAVVT